MKLYRRTKTNVEAVQFEPDRGVVEFADFVARYCVEMSMVVKDGLKAVVKLNDDTWVHIEPSAWLVRLEDGRVCGCSDEYFRGEFETV